MAAAGVGAHEYMLRLLCGAFRGKSIIGSCDWTSKGRVKTAESRVKEPDLHLCLAHFGLLSPRVPPRPLRVPPSPPVSPRPDLPGCRENDPLAPSHVTGLGSPWPCCQGHMLIPAPPSKPLIGQRESHAHWTQGGLGDR